MERELAELHPASFSWALGCCGGDAEEAEEVLQSVYLKILEGKARFAGRSSLKTWLFSVIRRTAWGRRRSRRLRRGLLDRWLGGPARATEPPEAESQALGAELATRLRALLGEISRRQREVLELVFYHELSVREAAAVMGVSVGTARVHYARGKKELARRLATEEGQ